MTDTPTSRDPLHGLTLEAIVTALAAHFGWAELGQRIDIRCFTQDPSVASSLKFLRKTPWARTKVESLYLFMLRDIARDNKRATAQAEIANASAICTPQGDSTVV